VEPTEYFETQSLRQEGPWDCGVEVFRKLAGVSREQLLRDLPNAVNGIPVIQWEEWLTSKGLIIESPREGEGYTKPCAHLIRRLPYYHWIYEDSTGIHDPDPAFAFWSPKLITLEMYPQGRELTISLKINR
jgi:hypothetical protein